MIAVSLEALCVLPIVFAIEGHDGAEWCWLWHRGLKALRLDSVLGSNMVIEKVETEVEKLQHAEHCGAQDYIF